MIRMKRTAFFLLCGLCCAPVTAQQMTAPPQMSIAPPATAELMKFIDYPVELSSGLVGVEIPLYIIKEGDIEIPLLLKYHGAGLKVAEYSNLVGLGWTLDCGPSFGRKINGLADEACYLEDGPSHDPSEPVQTYNDYLKRLTGGEKDEFPDVFYYKLLSKSGKFVYGKEETGHGGTPYPMEYIPFEPIRVVSDAGLSNFDVWDDAGFHYRFGHSLSNMNDSAFSLSASGLNAGRHTGWKIQEVISPDLGDTVFFKYHTERREIISWMLDDFVTLEDLVQGEDNTATTGRTWASYFYGHDDLRFPILTRGTMSDRSYVYNVVWDAEAGACALQTPQGALSDGEIPAYSGIPTLGGGTQENDLARIETRAVIVELVDNRESTGQNPVLSQILVKDKARQKVIRFIEFTHTDFGGAKIGKSKLDEIRIYDADRALIERYRFGYINPEQVPPANSRGVDHWGYSKVPYQVTNSSGVPIMNIPVKVEIGGTKTSAFLQVGEASKLPSPVSQNGLLRSITYPTGRETTFHYELNQYKGQGGTVLEAGGNRIRKIEEYDPVSGDTLAREFKYGQDEDGAGKLRYQISEKDYQLKYTLYTDPSTPGKGDETEVLICTSVPLVPPTFQNGTVVHYEHVTEYVTGRGKTEYVFRPSNDLVQGVDYTGLVYDGESGWSGGQLLRKTEYRYDPADGSYHPVREESNEYLFAPGTNVPYATYYRHNRARSGAVDEWGQRHWDDFFTCVSGTFSDGLVRLQSHRVRTFEGEEAATVTTTYAYGNEAHWYATTDSTTRSDGMLTVRKTYYPQDLAYPAENAAQETARKALIAANRLNTVLKHTTEVPEAAGDNKWTEHLHYAMDPATGLPMPQALLTGRYDNTEEQAAYTRYDSHGNLLETTGKDGLTTVLLWGYGYRYPVAEVRGAGYEAVEDALGAALIGRVAAAPVPAESDLQAIRELRADLPSALITTCTYEPAWGMTSMTAPNGLTTYYGYDASGRLKEVYILEDGEKSVLEAYHYHYTNP